MVLHKVTDWAECRSDDTDAWIHVDDVEWMKDLAKNLHRCKDNDQKRYAEREFHKDIKERYNGKVAGALLLKVWEMTAKLDEGVKDDRD